MHERAAVDTIKGYFYQFDFTIIKLLELSNDTNTIVVEGIEDIDIKTATDETAVQCKYYAKFHHLKDFFLLRFRVVVIRDQN